MAFAPGEQWAYCNSGYLLLGEIIERVSGQTYEAFLKEHIFNKLGMADTHYDMPTKIIPRRAAGYSNFGAGLENMPYISMTAPHAAGALASTVDDLAKWDAALYTEALLKQSTLKQAWTPFTLNDGTNKGYGYGWGIAQGDGFTIIEHAGGIQGFRTFAVRVPEHRLYVAVLANTENPALEPPYVAWNLALRAMGKPHHNPEPISIEQAALEKFVGQYKVNEQSTISISRQQAQVVVQFWEGMPPAEIIPLTPTEFFLKNSYMRFRFVADDMNPVPTLHFYDRGVLRETAKRQ